MNQKFKAGQIVNFMYQSSEATMEKEILILHPGWMRMVHAIDLKRITAAEREVLIEIMRPPSQDGKRHRIPLVNDIRRRMDVLHEIKNPMGFYARFVKVFLRTAGDCYRTYRPEKMSSIQVVRKSNMLGQQYNPKPLFKPVEPTKPIETIPTEPKRKRGQQKNRVQIQMGKKGGEKTPPQIPLSGKERLDYMRSKMKKDR